MLIRFAHPWAHPTHGNFLGGLEVDTKETQLPEDVIDILIYDELVVPIAEKTTVRKNPKDGSNERVPGRILEDVVKSAKKRVAAKRAAEAKEAKKSAEE